MQRQRSVLIGLFIAGTLLLLGAGMLLMGAGALFEHKQRALIYFERSVSGLQVGAPVSFRGVTVGQVERIALQLQGASLTARIAVVIALSDQHLQVAGATASPYLRELIAQGLSATLQSQSLVTGQSMIELDVASPGVTTAPVREAEGLLLIPTVPSDMEVLKDQLSSLPLAQTLQAAQQALQAMTQLSGEISQTAGHANELIQSAHTLVTSADQQLGLTAVQLRQLMAGVQQQLAGRGQELSVTLQHIDQAATALDTLTANLNAAMAPRSSTRHDLDSGLRDLAAAAASLRSFASQLERNPNTLLMGAKR